MRYELIAKTQGMQDCLRAYARVKHISLGKVLRNIARDFVRGAEAATPLAKRSYSEYWYYKDENGKRHYLHQNLLKKQVKGAAFTKTGKPRIISLRAFLNRKYQTTDEQGVAHNGLHKVKIAKGWSKAIWIGARQDLQMEMREPQKSAKAAPRYGEARVNIDTANPSITLILALHFEARPGTLQNILDAGAKRAYWHTIHDMTTILSKAWKG